MRSLRFRLAVLIFLVGILPAIVVGRSISAGNLEKHIKNRVQEMQYQCNTLSTQIAKVGFLTNPEENPVLSGKLELLAGVYDGRILLIDKNFKIVEDTYMLDEGRLDISQMVLQCFQGSFGIRYDDEMRYAQFAIPIYDTSDTKTIQGVMLVSTSTEKLASLEKSFVNRSGLLEAALVFILAILSVLASGLLLSLFRSW